MKSRLNASQEHITPLGFRGPAAPEPLAGFLRLTRRLNRAMSLSIQYASVKGMFDPNPKDSPQRKCSSSRINVNSTSQIQTLLGTCARAIYSTDALQQKGC